MTLSTGVKSPATRTLRQIIDLRRITANKKPAESAQTGSAGLLYIWYRCTMIDHDQTPAGVIDPRPYVYVCINERRSNQR